MSQGNLGLDLSHSTAVTVPTVDHVCWQDSEGTQDGLHHDFEGERGGNQLIQAADSKVLLHFSCSSYLGPILGKLMAVYGRTRCKSQRPRREATRFEIMTEICLSSLLLLCTGQSYSAQGSHSLTAKHLSKLKHEG